MEDPKRVGGGLPRRLTPDEYAVLDRILSAPVGGLQQLRDQLAVTIVVKQWPGSPSIDLSVDEKAPAADLSDGVVPVNAHVLDETGQYSGELIIWVTQGRLSGLEYSWITDLPPRQLPDIASVRLEPR